MRSLLLFAQTTLLIKIRKVYSVITSAWKWFMRPHPSRQTGPECSTSMGVSTVAGDVSFSAHRIPNIRNKFIIQSDRTTIYTQSITSCKKYIKISLVWFGAFQNSQSWQWGIWTLINLYFQVQHSPFWTNLACALRTETLSFLLIYDVLSLIE